jgi:hypothetical protein
MFRVCEEATVQPSDDVEHDEADSKKDIPLSVGGKRWLWEVFCLVIGVYAMAVVFGVVAFGNCVTHVGLPLSGILARILFAGDRTSVFFKECPA